jgi:hypothetical protein
MKKLAIVGTHPKTRDLAPFDDESFVIWVFNEAPQDPFCKRWDGCFQLHKPEVYTSQLNMVNGTHWAWLQQDHGANKTIWMQDRDARVPNSSRYPMDEIVQQIPGASPAGQPFFTSTVSMALALGLYLGYEEIHVWGVDLSSGTEYAYQQLCWLYWCGVAKAILGGRFVMHSGLQHFTARVYGYEGEVQIPGEHYQARVDFWNEEEKTRNIEAAKLRTKYNAALSDFDPKRFGEFIEQAQDAALAWGEAAGALAEARMYAERTDPISRQQFERRGAQAQIDSEKNREEMFKAWGEMQYVFNSWAMTRDARAREQVKLFAEKMLKFAYNAGGNTGVWNENARYMGEYDNRVTAAGGERTRKALGIEA